MRGIKCQFITLFLFCMVVCLSALRLRAGGTCSDTTATSTDDATHEEILSEFDPSQQILLDGNFYLGDVPSQIDSNLPQAGKKGPAAVGKLPDSFNSTKKPPKLVDGKPSKYSDENGDWYWGTDGHLYPWPPPPTQPETDDGTAPGVESTQSSVSAIAAGGDITADEALKKLLKAYKEEGRKWSESLEAGNKARKAAKKLSKAIDDAMDAEPGEEAKKAAKKVEDAAKEAEEAEKEHDKAFKEAQESTEKAHKAFREWEDATERATEEAEKQNEAARDAAEKAYEATGHGNKK